MATKAAYDLSVGETLLAQLDAISLRFGVDPSIVPQMPPYLDQLSRPWEPEEAPYKEEDEEDDDEDEEQGMRHQLLSPKLIYPTFIGHWGQCQL